MDMVIALFFYGSICAGVIAWFLPLAFEHYQKAQEANNQLLQVLGRLETAETEHRQHLTQTAQLHRRERYDNARKSAAWLVSAVGLFLVGTALLRIGFTAGQTAALVFATLFLATAFGLAWHLRRNWRRFAGARRGSRDLRVSRLHYVGIATGLFAGCLILAFGL